MARYEPIQNGKNGEACAFNGIGTTKAATSASGSCATSMSSIGPKATNTVSGGPVASGGAATTTSGIAVPNIVHQAVYIGKWQVAAYIVTALVSGVSMVML
ncbi:hypothetical protein N7474_008546 [Penicillium riverlandense]|uniref:uncharacterized protein n=1 Tax=Penicillium riverlandense TaxID=1903569 RepID=UPI00254993AB|nr:uncharacterized protein N7474_008546 [Penicillium riverlandense]KAJ5812245.1 hypothetical protein N7474_008546 [Penicillium riverlandense]